ncbi:Aminopeptidase YpdF [bioreactor metagenome]|uniref:Aminopeptidase YpdF n=1 Tax=bioreactor metagenome TaxID=1076179 RepID=A0A645D5P5_9ZZZZ
MIAEIAFHEALKKIKVGLSEKELAAFLEYVMRMNGADGISFETIAISGANTSKPHGVPSDKKIQDCDFVTMDFGAVYDGYHSDMTRTVAVGSVSDEQRNIYAIVLQAQMNALEGLKPGVSCNNADALARDVIAKKGFGEFFGHSTGHGVGIEIHEQPTLSPNNSELLSAGNVVTVEPGIYLPDKFGVRIEDMAAITEDGYENLTAAEKNLIILQP